MSKLEQPVMIVTSDTCMPLDKMLVHVDRFLARTNQVSIREAEVATDRILEKLQTYECVTVHNRDGSILAIKQKEMTVDNDRLCQLTLSERAVKVFRDQYIQACA